MELFLLSVVILGVVLATSWGRLHPFLALLAAALVYGIAAGMEPLSVVTAINGGFGATVGSIGIVIIAGSIIGTFLERSGGARGLAEHIVRLIGLNHTPLAMTCIGYFVSIPVFCDSAFVLLSPINRALAARAGRTVVTGAIALSLGLYSTHTMVPPTPGPVGAAGVLGAELGRVIVLGLLVAAATATIGWLFALIVTRHRLPEAATAQVSPEAEHAPPRPYKTLMPIVIPILLIVGRSIAEYPTHPLGEGIHNDWLSFLGQPVIALIIGVLLSFLLPARLNRTMLSSSGWVGDAVLAAAGIIVITGAGGAFGKVLQESGIGDTVGALLGSARSMGVLLPFLIAAGLKTAQGSSTVAMITAAGLVAPLLEALGLDSETGRALAVVGIGAGAMVVSHANDSYFWIVTQFSGLTLGEGYRYQSLGSLLQGIGAILVIFVISQLLL